MDTERLIVGGIYLVLTALIAIFSPSSLVLWVTATNIVIMFFFAPQIAATLKDSLRPLGVTDDFSYLLEMVLLFGVAFVIVFFAAVILAGLIAGLGI